MKYLLDTNACILLLAGDPQVVARASACDEGELAMSAIAFGEIAIGSWNGKPPPLSILDAMLRVITLVPFDLLAARCYARLPFKRASFERLIGAHALALDLPLVTSNERDFAGIPGLRVENWAA